MRTNATVSIPLPRLLTKAFFPYSVLVVVVALLFGGGTRQGLWSDVFVQIAALPLFAWALFRLSPVSINRSTKWALVLLCGILMLPVLQLIPLPPVVWSALPGRGKFAATYVAAGMALPWLPVSLDRYATWRGLVSLIPAAAVFLAMLSLDQSARRRIVVLVLPIAFIGVLLGLLQLGGGPGGPLRFYEITNYTRAVGLFANTNHHAAFLFCTIPIAVAWALGLMRDHSAKRTVGLLLLSVLLVSVVIGLAAANSRAGLALGAISGLASIVMISRFRGSNRRLLLYAAGAGLIALIIVIQFGFVDLLQRIEVGDDVMDDLRLTIAGVVWPAAIAHFPVGSGFGTFAPVYEMFSPPAFLSTRYVNHAHNDWLELWLTGGVPAAGLAVAFLAWCISASYSVWRSGNPGAKALDTALARAATIVIALLILHSVVDYPLRTAALSTLFGIACALLLPSHAGPAVGENSRREVPHERRPPVK